MSRVSTSCASGKAARDAQDRLVGKEHRPFRHGVDVAGEPQAGEIIDQVFAEAAAAREPLELLGRKAQLGEKIQHLLEAGRDQKAALARELAHEELEDRGFCLATIQVGLHHVELIEIGQQRACRRIHAATFAENTPRAHRDRLEGEFDRILTSTAVNWTAFAAYVRYPAQTLAVSPRRLSAGAECLSLLANPVAITGKTPPVAAGQNIEA